MLEVITVRLATHPAAIQEYVERTLLFYTITLGQIRAMVETAIQELVSEGFLAMDRFGFYEPTRLSQATVNAFMAPEDGLFVHDELQQALRAFVMDSELQIFYLFTPIQLQGLVELDWQIFRREVESLDDSNLRALEFIGVNPALVNKMCVEVPRSLVYRVDNE